MSSELLFFSFLRYTFIILTHDFEIQMLNVKFCFRCCPLIETFTSSSFFFCTILTFCRSPSVSRSDLEPHSDCDNDHGPHHHMNSLNPSAPFISTFLHTQTPFPLRQQTGLMMEVHPHCTDAILYMCVCPREHRQTGNFCDVLLSFTNSLGIASRSYFAGASV